MKKKHYLRFDGFDWLKRVNFFDDHGAEVVAEMLDRKNFHFLILGNFESGKTTFLHNVIQYSSFFDVDKCILPQFKTKSFSSLFKTQKWKQHFKSYKLHKSTITTIGYETHSYDEEKWHPWFAKTFDVIFDVRKLPNGERVLFSVYKKHGKGYQAVYEAPKKYLDFFQKAS